MISSQLDKIIQAKKSDIADWFQAKEQLRAPLFYSSVDIRNSGEKIAPVDTNIFPAGFNNLSRAAQDKASEEVSKYLKKLDAAAQKIILVTEFHTRNSFYLSNVNALKKIINSAGYEVLCASFAEDFNQALDLTDSNEQALTIYPLSKKSDKLHIAEQNFTADLVIVNNDLTSGRPALFENLAQPVIPPLGMGWYRRRKYQHFSSYNKLASQFAKEFGLAEFLISTELGFCKKVNFKERKGLECIAIEAEKTLSRLRSKYQEHNIKAEPYVYIKANNGTYGMGIMHVKDAEEVFSLNKKHRNKMHKIKSNVATAEILIQEGIATIDQYQNSPAEIFVYLINNNPLGSILRINQEKDAFTNLNSSGAIFKAADDLSEFKDKLDSYQLIARLAALAASFEDYDETV